MFTDPKALQILKEEQVKMDEFFTAMDAKIAKAQDTEYQTVKVKKCKCGNVLTLTARVIGHNQTSYRIEGSINVDADNRALCACNKVHHFRAPLEKWINNNQPNRLERN